MKIKKLIANNIKEGKQKVLEELGDDAVILSNRTIIDPKTSQEMVEIVAAIDDTERNKPPIEKIILPKPTAIHDKNADKYLETTQQIFDEISHLSDKISIIHEQIKFKFLHTYPDELIYFHRTLINNEFTEDSAFAIISEIYQHYPGNDRQLIEQHFKEIIAREIKFDNYLNKSAKQNIIVFVGPAGSGKSMSLMKMATIARLALESNVAIVSTDTYKISGLEQMQTFASIAAIPFAKAKDLEELKSVLSHEINRDMIFIDTIGKSAVDEENLDYIADLIKFVGANHIYLCLPANLSRKNFHFYLKKYQKLNPTGLIITKIDEAYTFGQIYESLKKENIPIAYFSTGQAVPEDFEKAIVDYFVKLLLNTR